MSFDWNDYVSLAADLNLGSPTDAQMRSATSRAYYGAFIQCRNKMGKSMKKEGAIHQEIIKDFKASDQSGEVSIGNLLDDLRQRRNDADYNGFFVPTQSATNLDIDKAKMIIANLKLI